jgi:hypothetical protein
MTTETMTNRTRQDAFERVLGARMGYLAGSPTSEFLLSLASMLDEWSAEARLAALTARGDVLDPEGDWDSPEARS